MAWFKTIPDGDAQGELKESYARLIEPPDFEPDGTWYSLAAVNGNLYAVEPNPGELDSSRRTASSPA